MTHLRPMRAVTMRNICLGEIIRAESDLIQEVRAGCMERSGNCMENESSSPHFDIYKFEF